MNGDGVIIQHAEKVYITTGAAQAVRIEADTSEFLSEQVKSGVSPEALKEMGYTDVPEEAPDEEAQETVPLKDETAPVARYQTPEERKDRAAINITARANLLRDFLKHTDRARRLQGLQTNHDHRPDDPDRVDELEHEEKVKAEEALRNACGHCALRNDCRLVDSVEKWFDAHPYKHRKDKLRPGSGKVLVIESRKDFIDALSEDPTVHCDPARRLPKAAPKAT